MRQEEFDREIKRLRDHFGDRHYSSELVAILWDEFNSIPITPFKAIIREAIATLAQSKPPLADFFREKASQAGVSATSWKYFQVTDCMTCGGCGWHYVFRVDGAEAVVACDECRAGKNIQVAPKPVITWTLRQCKNATYSRPGSKSLTHTPEKLTK